METQAHWGKIVKHNSDILFDVENPSIGLEIALKYQTHGNDDWSQFQRYPQMGFSLIYFNLGDKNILGNAYGLFPHLTINMLRTPKGFIQFQFGSGLAYLNRPFDYNQNPTQNAIGSKWNNITAFRFDGGYRINDNLTAQLGFGLTHFSNGGAQKPNLGINIISGTVGITYTPSVTPQNEFIYDEKKLNIPQKRWGYQMHFDLAYREFAESGGPRFPVYIGSVGAVFHFNAVNRMVFGFDAEYNQGMYHYVNHIYSHQPPKKLKKDASRLMFFVADEFMFGDFGVFLQTGIYLHKGEGISSSIYNKLSVRYYLPPIGKPATRFFVAVYLKNHLAVAEYISFGMGAHL